MILVLGQLAGQAGPIRLRCSMEVGAASQASTRGLEVCIDQFREKAHDGLGTLRWCAACRPRTLLARRSGRVTSEMGTGVCRSKLWRRSLEILFIRGIQPGNSSWTVLVPVNSLGGVGKSEDVDANARQS